MKAITQPIVLLVVARRPRIELTVRKEHLAIRQNEQLRWIAPAAHDEGPLTCTGTVSASLTHRATLDLTTS